MTETISRISVRGAIASIKPCSRCVSEVCWSYSILEFSFWVIPTGLYPKMAPGSPIVISAKLPKLAKACPVDGFEKIDMNGKPLSLCLLMAIVVFAICITDKTPSWILEPPPDMTETIGNFFLVAFSMAREIFWPAAQPIDPPMNPKSNTIIMHSMPSIEHTPVSTASVIPVRF